MIVVGGDEHERIFEGRIGAGEASHHILEPDVDGGGRGRVERDRSVEGAGGRGGQGAPDGGIPDGQDGDCGIGRFTEAGLAADAASVGAQHDHGGGLEPGGDRWKAADERRAPARGIDDQHFAADLFGGEGIEGGGIERRFDSGGAGQIGGGRVLESKGGFGGLERLAAGFERQFEAIQVGRDVQVGRGLEVAVVAGGVEARAAELGGDELGRDVEAGGGRAAALQGVGGQERYVGPKILGCQMPGDIGGHGDILAGGRGREADGGECRHETCVIHCAFRLMVPRHRGERQRQDTSSILSENR